MLGRSDPGDSIAAMANDVIDSFLVNFAVSNSLNTSEKRTSAILPSPPAICNPRRFLPISPSQMA